MERQKLELYTTNQSLVKENNGLKESFLRFESEINEQRVKDEKEKEVLKERIAQLESETRETNKLRQTIYKKDRELEDVERLLTDMQEEPYMDLEASCD